MKKTKKLITGFIILFLGLGIFLSSPQETNAKDEKKERKILYYRNPMDPSVTSPTFMKDSMGMDYIPVYEEREEELSESTQGLAIKISQSQQQLISVETEPIIARPLMRMIRTVAKIAYDPGLYKAEQEYIQALKIREDLKSSQSPEVIQRAEVLILAAELRLKLMGISEEQIEELKKETESDRSLIISDASTPYAWAYAVIYEYDIGLVEIGDHVVVKTIAYPDAEFIGTVKAIDPVLDAHTRSVRLRVLIDNPQAKLKPNMYADALIHIDLGTQLAVPREAVLDTGLRKIVYLEVGKNQFRAQELEVGPEAVSVVMDKESKFFPVIKGLKENDVVVTKGNFLIDSQSQLSGGMSALWGGATEIKEEGEIKSEHRH